MKTKYWLMILGTVLAVCLGLSAYFLMPGEEATHAEILSQGTVIKTVDLRTETETSDVNAVMDGNIQQFIESWLQMKASEK